MGAGTTKLYSTSKKKVGTLLVRFLCSGLFNVMVIADFTNYFKKQSNSKKNNYLSIAVNS